MDKWKDGELAKMKAGGNKKGKEFLRTQPDFKSEWDNSSITGAGNIRSLLVEKYNSKALALLRDKVACESDGKKWDEYSSSGQNWTVPQARKTGASGVSSGGGSSQGVSSSFDDRFKQNQSSSNFINDQQLFDSASDVASKGFGMLSAGLGKSWGFASSIASTATQKVQSGEIGSLANSGLTSGLGFLSNVATTSLNTASKVVNTGMQNMPNSNSDFSMSGANGGGQKEPEQADFWNKFGNKNDTPSSAGFGSSIWGESKPQSKTDGSFGGFGGGNQEEEKEADGISDLYGGSKGGDFQGFGGAKKKDEAWGDDW